MSPSLKHYRQLTKEWRELRATMVLGKSQEDALSTSLENRHEVEHYNHKKLGVRMNHIPSTRERKAKPVTLKPNRYQRVVHLPLPGEIPIKVWAMAEAAKLGVRTNHIWRLLKNGKYPEVKRRWVNPRVVFVSIVPNDKLRHGGENQ